MRSPRVLHAIFVKSNGFLHAMLTLTLPALRLPQPASRAKAIKVLREVVRSDASTLSLRNVTIGVTLALQDTSIAVRKLNALIIDHTLMMG